jgi:CRISPR-associated endoribonuclease Cas6
MRIHLKINGSREIVPFNHQHLLTGVIHKWIGRNEEHGKLSLYSFSRLERGEALKNGLKFQDGTSMFFSAVNADIVKQMISGIQTDPTMFHGLKVSEIIIQEDPDFSQRDTFSAASPVFIKRRVSERIDHIKYDNAHAGEYLVETLKSKMKSVGMEDDSLDIQFNLTYPKAKTTLVTYNSIQNKANICPVIIKGLPETKAFAWNVGLGNSTGIGFGAIK